MAVSRSILTTANDLKYTRAIQTRLAEWVVNPSEDFVRLAAAELLGTKRFTPVVRDQFTQVTRRPFEQLIGERINERLKGAMTPESLTVADPTPLAAVPSAPPAAANAVAASADPLHETSAEEIEAFHTIRAILRGVFPSKRIVMRDAQTYCAVLLDDNNRKPVCRLRFNNPQKLRLGVFNVAREEEQFPLDAVNDLYNYADQLKATVTGSLTPAT